MIETKEPRVQQLGLPKDYGSPKDLVDWRAVEEKLVAAPAYWLATTRPDGRPHVVPVDGLWLDGAWYWGGSRQSVHQRNLAHHRDVVMHLEDAQSAVIVEGEAERISVDERLATRLIEGTKAKYGWQPEPDTYAGGAWMLRPKVVIAWTTLYVDATKFVFE